MKKKIFLVLTIATSGVALFVLLCFSFFTSFPFKSFFRPRGLIVLAIILIFNLILSYFLSEYWAEMSRYPIRAMLSYIDKLMGGKLGSDEVNTEEELAIASYLKFEQDKKNFLKRLSGFRQAENMRRQFSANVSHELKSPLTSINGYAELIEAGLSGPEDNIRFAKIIREEGERLLTIIDETIQLSQFDTNAYEDIRKDLNFSKLIREEKSRLSHDQKQKNVEIILLDPLENPEEDIHFKANEYLMRMVVQNILSNAVKYSKSEGGKVWVSLKKDPKNLVFKVKDQGIGISEEDQKHIFERFYVVDPGRSRMTGASRTGLGLALVKHTVLSYNGKVNVYSKRGEGSTFEVILPVEG